MSMSASMPMTGGRTSGRVRERCRLLQVRITRMTPPLETLADLEELLSRVTDYEKETGYRYSGGTFDLARMRELLGRLGHPERAFASIHVAGTKGKGSVSATAAALLRTTGAS